MKFIQTPIQGVAVVELMPHVDERGFFARSFCQDEFAGHGLLPMVAQCNVSYNHVAGTLRGMHFQVAPATGGQAGAMHFRRDRRPDSRPAR